jgi:signal transduction histidine kinase
MFRVFTRAYIHFGRIPWWRIVLGLFVLGAAIATFAIYPTHRALLKATSLGDQREAALRVIRSAAVVEARRIGIRAAGVEQVGPRQEPDFAPSPPMPPTPPEPKVSVGARSSEPPRVVIADGRISIRHEDVARDIDAAVSDAERQVKEALKAVGIEETRANEEARRMVATARKPVAVEEVPERGSNGKTDPNKFVRPSDNDVSINVDDDSRWHVRIWGIDFEGSGFDNIPDDVAREPLLTRAQQTALERATQFDVRKAIYGGLGLAAFGVLALLLLVTRAFAGRSARQTQRVKVVEAAAKVDSSARQIAEAQLKAMQAQVEPHFLFNTLAHVKALQDIDVKQAGLMLDHLIAYLRTALPNLREGSSTLGKEFELAQAYLNILKLRMGERMQFSLDLPESLKTQAFPPALIINLVENAIKHGVERARGGGSVRLNAQRVGDKVTVSVADTGKGLDPSAPGGTGVGLTSIRDRLRLLYGEAAGLALEPNSPSGVIATLTLPATMPEIGATPSRALNADGSPRILAHDVSECTVYTSILLAGFGGLGGAHRWYLRRKKTAALQAVLGFSTLLGAIESDVPVPMALVFVIWWVADLVLIATKSMKDGDGRRVVIDR